VSSDLTARALDSNFLVRLLSVTVVPKKLRSRNSRPVNALMRLPVSPVAAIVKSTY